MHNKTVIMNVLRWIFYTSFTLVYFLWNFPAFSNDFLKICNSKATYHFLNSITWLLNSITIVTIVTKTFSCKILSVGLGSKKRPEVVVYWNEVAGIHQPSELYIFISSKLLGPGHEEWIDIFRPGQIKVPFKWEAIWRIIWRGTNFPNVIFHTIIGRKFFKFTIKSDLTGT